MTINRTTLLDLPLPVTGTEAGTWGDVTNNGLTEYLDIAIAGMVSLTSSDFTAGALTIATTEGNSSGTNIANSSAQYATLKVSSLAANSTITAPASARAYRVINADATYTLTVKASGQTGVTFQPGTTGMVAFNGTDYEIVGVVGPASATDNAVARFDGTTGQIVQNSGVTIDDSNNVSGVAQLNATTADLTNIEVTNLKAKDGTAAGSIADSTGVVSITANPVLSAGTANGVLFLNGSKVATSGSALTFDGTTLGVSSGSSSTPALKLYGAAVSQGQLQFSSTSGYAIQGGPDYTGLVYNVGSASYQHIFQINSSEQMRLTSTGLGIGTSSPTNKLEVATTTTNTGITIYNNNGSGGLNARLGFKSLNGYDASSVLAAVTAVPNASSNTATALTFATSGDNSVASAGLTERMRLDSSGNLGLGVTPSANTIAKAFELQNGFNLFSAFNIGYINANAYFDSNWKYKNSAAAGRYEVADSHKWYTAPSGTAGNAITFSQVMTVDSAGNWMVGATSALGRATIVQGASSNADTLILKSPNASGAGSQPGIQFLRDTDAALAKFFADTNSGALITEVAGSERMRIDSSGNLLVGTTSGATNRFIKDSSGGIALQVANSSTNTTSSAMELNVNYTGGTSGWFVRGGDSSIYRFYIYSNGDMANTNNSYGAISDAKLKENVTDATPKLEKLQQVRVVNYNLIGEEQKLLGVIAQELEQIFPSMIDESPDRDADGNDLGTTTKSVKYSVFVPMLIKAIQELKSELDSVKAELATLKGN